MPRLFSIGRASIFVLLCALSLSLPARAQFVSLTALSLSPSTVSGGAVAHGTVLVNNPAPANGTGVLLSSSNSGLAPVPQIITVPAGQTSATFDIPTQPVNSTVSVTITASAGVTKTATLTLVPVAVSGLSLNPTTLGGGQSSIGIVTLSGSAPTGGVSVSLSSSDPAATVPSSVTVPAGAVTANFTISTIAVSATKTVTITATKNGSKTATLTVKRPTLSGQPGPPFIPGFKVPTSRGQIICPDTVLTGVLTLDYPAPAGGAIVSVASDDANTLPTPGTVTIPAGQITASFTMTARMVIDDKIVTLTAEYGVVKTVQILVSAPALSEKSPTHPAEPYGIAFSPSAGPNDPNAKPVCGGSSVTGTVSINCPAPAGGAVVTLTNSDTLSVSIPPYVRVPQGQKSATFTATTAVVTATKIATITARYGKISGQARVTALAPGLTDGKDGEPEGLILNPTSVRGGASATATINLTCPAIGSGAKVYLTSSNTAAATVPAYVILSAGQSVKTVSVTTRSAVNSLQVTITASYNGETRTAPLAITNQTAFDFNADGFGDLLFQNTQTGQIGAYLLRGATPLSFQTIFNTGEPAFFLAAAPDLNGDNSPDLIFQNTNTGAVVYWLLSGTHATRTGTIFASGDPNYVVVGAPDLNGDNIPDLLFRNRRTGAVVYWLLDRNYAPKTFGTIFASGDTHFQLVATPDLNGDAHPDLVFQNTQTGAVTCWLMSGTTPSSSRVIFTSGDTHYRAAGAFDVNGDGKPDLIFQNTQTGAVTYWLLNGTTPTTSGVIFGSGDLAFSLVGVH